MGIEPTTLMLATLRTTTVLFPHGEGQVVYAFKGLPQTL